MRHVSVLAIPRRLGSALTIPLEMLTAANDIASVYKQQIKFARSTLSPLSNSNAG